MHTCRALDAVPGWWVQTPHHVGRIAWIARPPGVGYGAVVLHYECGQSETLPAATRITVH